MRMMEQRVETGFFFVYILTITSMYNIKVSLYVRKSINYASTELYT